MPQASAYLFVPGNRPERFAKACLAAPGLTIIDLEDAVPPDQKDGAREAVRQWLDGSHQVILRINADGSDWFGKDLELTPLPGVATVMLPKAETVQTLRTMTGSGKPVIPLIETAIGIAQARALAREAGVDRLAFGSIDLQADLGISGDGEELHAFRSELVLASRLAGVKTPIDGVTTAIDDIDILRADALRAKRFGFGAKLCIHPKQLDVVRTVFAPTSSEIDWATRILAAIETTWGAAVSVDGKMVDKPVVELARRIMRAA